MNGSFTVLKMNGVIFHLNEYKSWNKNRFEVFGKDGLYNEPIKPHNKRRRIKV